MYVLRNCSFLLVFKLVGLVLDLVFFILQTHNQPGHLCHACKMLQNSGCGCPTQVHRAINVEASTLAFIRLNCVLRKPLIGLDETSGCILEVQYTYSGRVSPSSHSSFPNVTMLIQTSHSPLSTYNINFSAEYGKLQPLFTYLAELSFLVLTMGKMLVQTQ